MHKEQNQLKIAFFGTPEYSLLVLNNLFETGLTIVCIVTKPLRPVGRKQEMTQTPVAQWAKQHQIPLLTPPADKTKPWLFADEVSATDEILKFKPDILITADYTQKIPLNLIKQVKFGGLNIHPSLLPAYRGPAPVPWAIINGETETGVTILTLSQQLDSGTIIAQEKEPILPADKTPDLLFRLFEKGADLLIKVLPGYISQYPNLQRTTHLPNLQPSYLPRLTRDHGFESWINIKQAIKNGSYAVRIERKWRAFHPWPGLWTQVKIHGQKKRLKILSINLKPATNLSDNLQLDEIQLEGKQPVSGKDVRVFIDRLLVEDINT